ncbi:MAG TPA: hypothetical protein DEV93_06965 [Chloroflexi bacterium]|nr:hypothetical protein [Chloroflexota bacterium]
MNNIIIVLLVIAAVKFVVFGWLLYRVFQRDLEQYENDQLSTASTVPVCVYCQSAWTKPVDEGQTRWEGGDLVLVTTYECEHCRLPFWHVERVSVSKISV